MTKRDNNSEDGESLWQHVLQSVKPLVKKREQHVPQKENLSAPHLPPPSEPKAPATTPRIMAEEVQKDPPQTTTTLPNRDIDRRSMEKLRKGKMAIEARMDLHGMREEEAHRVFNRFIRGARSSGKRCVLVITGKGKSPQSEGKLRRALPLWIETSFTREVLAFCPAATKDGGSGAWYILLRRTRE